MAGIKGRSGRKKQTANVKETKITLDKMLPQALKNIEGKVEQGDADLSRWVAEMCLGKPRQQLEGTFGPDENALKALEYLGRLAELREAQRIPMIPVVAGKVVELDADGQPIPEY